MRGRLVFTTEITIIPHIPLKGAKLYLSNGWFQAMTLNELQPDPSSQEAQRDRQILDFGKLPVGTAFHVWIAWQVNRANVGRHAQHAALYDGGPQLMLVQPEPDAIPLSHGSRRSRGHH